MFDKKTEYLGDEYESENKTQYIGDEYTLFKGRKKSKPNASAIQNYNAKPKNGCTCTTPQDNNKYAKSATTARNGNYSESKTIPTKYIIAVIIVVLFTVIPTIIEIVTAIYGMEANKREVQEKIREINAINEVHRTDVIGR